MPPTTLAPGNECPFNTLAYAPALRHVGDPEPDSRGRLHILRRPIPGTTLSDGSGPWPYLWIGSNADTEALRRDFPHLVTIAAVTQPGYTPPPEANPLFLKDHFVFDPALPWPELSKRARTRLRHAEAEGTFEVIDDPAARAAMAPIYAGMVDRRGLHGGLFDVQDDHFAIIAGLPQSRFFRVRRSDGIGAMACGVAFGDWLQILHTAVSPDGLHWNAAYLLMRGLQEYAATGGYKVLTGGMPDGGAPGLRIFKLRWANLFLPVHLVRFVNDQQTYAELAAAGPPTNYFPAYRSPPPRAPT